LLCFLLTPHFILAQERDNKIIIGEIIKIQSKVLNEERKLLVYLPEGYDRSEEKYPVLYGLDGHQLFHYTTSIIRYFHNFGRMPKMILIRVLNTDRGRDFTPTKIPTESSGGADNFLEFMRNELFPFVDQNYRTHPFRILHGHSLCGMFAIYTLLTAPDMFNAYIATSPSLWWDKEFVVKQAETILKKQSTLNKFLFINFGGGDSEFIKASTWGFAKVLEKYAPPDLEWKVTFSKDEDHVTIPILSFPNGLELLYSDWMLSKKTLDKGVQSVENHFNYLSEKFGYEIPVPESAYNSLGYNYLNQKKFEEAIEIFKLNVKLYPNSWNV